MAFDWLREDRENDNRSPRGLSVRTVAQNPPKLRPTSNFKIVLHSIKPETFCSHVSYPSRINITRVRMSNLKSRAEAMMSLNLVINTQPNKCQQKFSSATPSQTLERKVSRRKLSHGSGTEFIFSFLTSPGTGRCGYLHSSHLTQWSTINTVDHSRQFVVGPPRANPGPPRTSLLPYNPTCSSTTCTVAFHTLPEAGVTCAAVQFEV
jgi:hypothetical protein